MSRIFAPLWSMQEGLGRLRHGWFGLDELPGVFATLREVDHCGQRVVDWSLVDASAKISAIDQGTEPDIVAAKIAAEGAFWDLLSAHQKLAVIKRLHARKPTSRRRRRSR